MSIKFTVFKGSKDGSIVKSTTTKGELNGDEVLVRVTCSGVCGTDDHYRTQDMVLGHEGAGVVERTGPGVKSLKEGMRVGWGYQHDCCGQCELCLSGRETYCRERKMYGSADKDQGSFASHAVWKEQFLFKIPEGLSDEVAAPLMCGGATVFNIFEAYEIRPTSRVGIVGIGGLGHLAIQFAAKQGMDVVVFSGTESKREEAMKLGAKEFYATKDAKKLKLDGGKIDHLLVTTSFLPDWNLYIPILAAGATIYPLSVADGDFAVPYMPLLANGLRIQGSIVASRYIHNRMLKFAALHNIKPISQSFPMNVDGITKAMKQLADGNMRYRGVLIPESTASL